MIHFERFTLDNGLKVLLHEDHGTPLVAVNILYDVGARDEDPEHTGFAHLFEHLMFGGSVNIPSYDAPLQIAGGENNAFTNNDITNYYITLPAQNLETALWLESDRMLSLAFSEKSLDVQRNVVIEEFKQRYLNQPYGDVWLKLRPLAYTRHPYQWATIGKEVSHIEQATLEQVKSFFSTWYRPDNAILCLAGAINTAEALELVKKWFGTIPAGKAKKRDLPTEPLQTSQRRLELHRDVPASHIYLAFHCCARNDAEFYATDLLSDILSRGKSSRLYQSLVKEQQLFTEIGAYMLGDFDKSLFVVEGKLVHGVDVLKAEDAIFAQLNRLTEGISERELDKVKHKAEASFRFSEMGVASKALNLCYFELLGDANESNLQPERYNAVTESDILQVAKTVLRPENCSILHYLSTQHA